MGEHHQPTTSTCNSKAWGNVVCVQPGDGGGCVWEVLWGGWVGGDYIWVYITHYPSYHTQHIEYPQSHTQHIPLVFLVHN